VFAYITCVDDDHEGREAAIRGSLSKAAQQCVHSDQPTQPNSTEVVQLLTRRDVLGTLEAAEELKLAISARPGELAVLTSVPPCNPPPPAVPAVTL